MCLAFIRSQKPKVKIANSNITIYKFVKHDWQTGGYISLFRDAPISIGLTYNSPLDKPADRWGSGCLCSIDNNMLANIGDELVYVSQGLHAFSKKCFNDEYLFREYYNILSVNVPITILKGYIPDGANYYENDVTGLVASSSIIYTEEVSL